MRIKYLKAFKKYIVRTSRRLLFKKILVFLISFLFLISVFSILFRGRILNNTYFGRINVGGVKSVESGAVIKQVLDDYQNKSLIFVLEDKTVEEKIMNLGVNFDLEGTSSQLYIFGESRNLLNDLILYSVSLFKTNKVKPVYAFDPVKFNQFIDREFSSLERQSENAKFINSMGKISVADSKDGEVVNRVLAASDFASRLDGLSEFPIDLEVVSVFPNINSSEIRAVLDEYSSLLSKRIILSWGYDSWKLEGEDLISLVKVERTGSVDGFLLVIHTYDPPIYLKNVKFDNVAEAEVGIAVDDEALAPLIGKISKVVNRPTINATAKFDGTRITEFTPAIDGQELNVKKAKEEIVSFVSGNLDNQKLEYTIKLPVIVTTAKVANEQINSLGIKELIGRGVSYFSGSIANRIFNIELGTDRLNGTLVAPGEIFSFNNTVGEVSGKTGYKQAYVISSGRTVLDDGGGICQVSTTIFRAALNSGLPIISRTAHAYRVGYYEQRGFGPGLDATVFAPSVDFKFRNDTDNYILIQTVFNRANSMLEVDIYGTKDTRRVEVGKPVILSRTPAPPEIRQDDPALPKGTIKQVDFAAEGADVYFKRKVFQNEKVLYDDTFKSKFRPWQAVFLVGTGG